MKTGIIRRVDDLGRIVIPKEIRNNLGIREGEAMEISISDNGSVCFTKCSPAFYSEVSAIAERIKEKCCGDSYYVSSYEDIDKCIKALEDIAKALEHLNV